jgi:cell division septation protein DedD
LQVGAFSDPESAKSAVDDLRGTYPVAVLSAESGDRSLYRLFVGPLNEDERGSVLYWIRGKGYQDAFIRKGGA